MVVKLYCVWDKVREESSPIFTAKNDGTAIRDFKTSVPKEMKEDYELFFLGTYNFENMEVLPQKEPVKIELEF